MILKMIFMSIQNFFLLGCVFKSTGEKSDVHELEEANLATTYTAIATLSILGDDFSRLDGWVESGE